jgi:transposase-like protein
MFDVQRWMFGSCRRRGAFLHCAGRVGVCKIVPLLTEEPMDFPIQDLMDEQACYDRLLQALHPDGLACPRCGARDHLGIHRRHRAPLIDYQCAGCARVFNCFTETTLHGTHRSCSQLVLILRGVAQGVSTSQLARELGCDRGKLLALRHRLQERAADALDRTALVNRVVECDEMYQNAGEKRAETR